MLRYAEDECSRRKISRLELSMSELQSAALVFYKDAGHQLTQRELVEAGSNKTVGSSIQHFILLSLFGLPAVLLAGNMVRSGKSSGLIARPIDDWGP